MKIIKLLPVIPAFIITFMLCFMKTSAQEATTSALTDITECISTSCTVTTEITKNGWITDNGKTYYYTNNSKVIGYQVIDEKEYYFSANGNLKSGWYTIDGVRMYFSPETYERQLGWINYRDNLFFINEQGKLTGRHTIDKKEYIFNEGGICMLGWFEYEGNKYYSDFNKGLYKNKCVINGTTYYFSSKGKYKSGFITSDNRRIFYDYETVKPIYGFVFYNGEIYYVDTQKGKLTGEVIIDNLKYKFDDFGCQQIGLQQFSDGTRYYDENGTPLCGFVHTNEKSYFFSQNYLMQTGFKIINGNKYYFGDDGVMKKGFYTIDNKTYYFDENGIMLTGWQTISNNKYCFNNKGEMYTGWQQLNGKYYLFDNSGKLQPSPKIFVGVGHGGYDSGAVSYIVEKEYTLKTAKVVAEYLSDWGLDFMLSREEDIDTTMESKLKLCNDYEPDLIIDIHFNAVGNGGFEVYHSQYGGMSLTLAENINDEVSKIMHSQGCKIMLYPDGRDRFTIIRETHAPAVLLEGGFVDIYSDAEFIKNNYKLLAKAYAEGVLKTLNLIMSSKT